MEGSKLDRGHRLAQRLVTHGKADLAPELVPMSSGLSHRPCLAPNPSP